ncbi:MAG: hypothetical protein QW636_07950 [Candidatus Bathyarchaeia archaeon]
MNRFRKDRRGQFVILVAVIIAAFMFSLILSIGQINARRQEVSYEPVDETVLAITSDFERCLTRALAIATQNYSETWDMDLAKISGEKFINDWLKVLLESYQGFGIDITLIPEKGTGKNIAWAIDWDKKEGISMVYTTFGMNIKAYGLKNLAITMQRTLYLEILNTEVKLNNSDSLIIVAFRVCLGGMKKRFIPVSDLAQANVKLLVNGTNEIKIESLEYLNQGTYRATFNFDGSVIKYITLIVTDNNGIRVAARWGSCILFLESDDLSTQGIDNEGSFTINGTTVKLQHAPYVLSLFTNQTLAISFAPPTGSEFKYFSSIGFVDVSQNGVNAIIKVKNYGYESVNARVIAHYNSSSIPTVENCNITLMSLEDGGATFNLGNITLTWSGVSQTFDELPASVLVPYNEWIEIKYDPEPGYLFKYWEWDPVYAIEMDDSFSSSTVFRATSNGTIIAVYSTSRPAEWRTIYLAPLKEKGAGSEKKEEFSLTIKYPDELPDVTPRLNNPHDSRKGETVETTPTDLLLGEEITIIIWAKYTKEGKEKDDYINVKFTLGYIDSEGVFHEIGNNTASIGKSSGPPVEQPPIYISPNIEVIPAGSKIVLIIERLDEGEGTLHIDCGPGKSRIILW